MNLRLLMLCVALCPAVVACADDAPAPPTVTFDDDVKAIFRAKCTNCHNTDKKMAGLDLTNYTSMMAGGGSGTAVEPGDAGSSYLYMLVSHESEPYMPPNSPKMDDASLGKIQEWINLGAPENKGSKVAKKKTVDLSLSGVPTGKPDGPPPMPPRLPLEPIQHTARADAVTALAASPWAPLVAVGGFQQVLLYNTQTLELIGVLPFPEGVPQTLKFSRNGKLLLAGGGRGAYQGLCVVWDITTGQRIAEVGDETDAVLAADISPDQKLVALGGPSKKVKVYSTLTGELQYELNKHTEWVYAIEFSPDGVLLATADRNGGLIVWEAASGQEFLVLDGHKAAVNDVSWRPDSNLLASCDDEGQIRLWELENGKQVKNWGAHGGGTKAIEFNRDGRIVSCGADNAVKLWEPDGKERKRYDGLTSMALQVTFSADPALLIAGDWNGDVRAWSAEEGQPVGLLTPNPPTVQERVQSASTTLLQVQATRDAAAAALAPAEQAATAATALVEATKVQIAAAEQAKAAAQAQFAQLEARIAALPAEQGDNTPEQIAERQTVTAEREVAKAAVESADATLTTKRQELPQREAEAKAKQEAVAAPRQAMAEADAALAAAQAAVKRWQDELAFAAQVETANASAAGQP